jgi:hypothetical protein
LRWWRGEVEGRVGGQETRRVQAFLALEILSNLSIDLLERKETIAVILSAAKNLDSSLASPRQNDK